jgi:hypothetical protein
MQTSPSKKIEIAVAWYRREEWPALLAASADAAELEATYDEWLANAEKMIPQMEAHGIHVVKIDVEVNALVRWCAIKNFQVDGAARADYAAEGLRRKSQS